MNDSGELIRKKTDDLKDLLLAKAREALQYYQDSHDGKSEPLITNDFTISHTMVPGYVLALCDTVIQLPLEEKELLESHIFGILQQLYLLQAQHYAQYLQRTRNLEGTSLLRQQVIDLQNKMHSS